MNSTQKTSGNPKKVAIFGGGTLVHLANHTSFCSFSRGTFAKNLALRLMVAGAPVSQHLTFMAGGNLVTNEDVKAELDKVLADPVVGAIVFSTAVCDIQGHIPGQDSGKYAPRIQSRDLPMPITLSSTPKLLPAIKASRPDIFVVGFKATANDSTDQQVAKANRQLLESQVDLVLANDTVTRINLFVNSTKQVQLLDSREEATDLLAQILIKAVM